MTTAMRAVRRGSPGEPARNALRVAIARAGRIDREWVVESGSVTFGRSDHADVVVAGHGTNETTLLVVEGGAITLAVPAGASGRLQLESGPRDLATLVGTTIALDANGRGRIVLAGAGDDAVAVLFQRVPAPEKRMRPELPASVRGGLLDRVDWLFTALAAASFMLHLGLVVGLSEADWPMPPSLAVIDDRIAETVFSEATIPPMPQIDDTPDPTDPSTPSDPTPSPSHDPSPTHDPSHAPSRAPSTPHASDPDPTIALDAAIASANHVLLGANGLGGIVDDLLRNATPTDHPEDILATVDGVGVATRDPGPRDHTTGVPDGTFGPRIAGHPVGPRHEGDPIQEEAPRPVHVALTPSDDPPDPGIFDDAMLRRALRARMHGIQQCYEHELTRTPGLAGRITLALQVERIGSVSHVEAVDDTVGSRGLTDCVLNNVRTIRLADGPSEPITVEYPIVFAPQD